MDRINHWTQKCQTERNGAAFSPKQYAGAEGRGTSCAPVSQAGLCRCEGRSTSRSLHSWAEHRQAPAELLPLACVCHLTSC